MAENDSTVDHEVLFSTLRGGERSLEIQAQLEARLRQLGRAAS